MRYVNDIQTINNSGTTTTIAFDAGNLVQFSAQAVFSDGTAAGALKLQASNDPVGSVTHWNDVPNSSQTVASGATTLIPFTQVCYRWVRVAFVSSGGAGTIAVHVQGQGF